MPTPRNNRAGQSITLRSRKKVDPSIIAQANGIFAAPFGESTDVLEQQMIRAASGKLEDHDDLVTLLAPFPYSARIAIVCHLAAKSSTQAINNVIQSLLSTGEGVSPSSSEDGWELIFPVSETSACVSHERRQLAMFVAASAADGAAALKELGGQSLTTRKLALLVATKSLNAAGDFSVDDAELLSRLILDGSNSWSSVKALLASCIRSRRIAVLDEALPLLLAQSQQISQYLHGASSDTVRRLLGDCLAAPDNSKLSWAKLWQFHSAVVFEALSTELKSADRLQKKAVWARWSCRIKRRTYTAFAPKFFELFVTHQSHKLLAGCTAAVRKAIMAACKEGTLEVLLASGTEAQKEWARFIEPEEPHSDFVTHVLRPGVLPITLVLDFCSKIKWWVPDGKNDTNGTDPLRAPPKGGCGPMELAVYSSLPRNNGRDIQEHFKEIRGLVESGLQRLTMPQVYGSKWHDSTQLLKSLIDNDKLSCDQTTELLALLRKKCEDTKPTPERFGADAVIKYGKNMSLVPLLMPEKNIIDMLSSWEMLATLFAKSALYNLCKRQVACAKAGKNIKTLDHAIATVFEQNLHWAVIVLEESQLQVVWDKVGPLINSTRSKVRYSAFPTILCLDGHGKRVCVPNSKETLYHTPNVLRERASVMITEEIKLVAANFQLILKKHGNISTESSEKVIAMGRLEALMRLNKIFEDGTKMAKYTYNNAQLCLPESVITEVLEQCGSLYLSPKEQVTDPVVWEDKAFALKCCQLGRQVLNHYINVVKSAEEPSWPSSLAAYEIKCEPYGQATLLLAWRLVGLQESMNRKLLEAMPLDVQNTLATRLVAPIQHLMPASQPWTVADRTPSSSVYKSILEGASVSTNQTARLINELDKETLTIKMRVLRELRANASVHPDTKRLLASHIPITDPGIRAELERAYKAKSPQDRYTAIHALMDSSRNVSDPEWQGIFHGTKYKNHVMKLARTELLTSFQFARKAITNEHLENRNLIQGAFVDCLTQLPLLLANATDDTVDSDMERCRTIVIGLVKDTLATAVQASESSSALYEATKPFKRAAESFCNVALRIYKPGDDQAIPGLTQKKRALMLDVAAEIEWLLVGSEKSSEDRISIYQVPFQYSWILSEFSCPRKLRDNEYWQHREHMLEEREMITNLVLDAYAKRGIEAAQFESAATPDDESEDEVKRPFFSEKLQDGTEGARRLDKIIRLAGPRYNRHPTLLSTATAILEKRFDNDDSPHPTQEIIAKGIKSVYGIEQRLNSRGSPGRKYKDVPKIEYQDALLTTFWESVFNRTLGNGPNETACNELLGRRFARKYLLDISFPTKGVINVPHENMSARQARRSAAIAAMFNECPESAVCNQRVRSYLMRWRQDVITATHLASEVYPKGKFAPRTKTKDKWRWPDRGYAAFGRLTEKQLEPLSDAFMADVRDADKTEKMRSAAAARMMALPGTPVDEVWSLVKNNSDLLDTDSGDGEREDGIPNAVLAALYRGLMRSEDIGKAFRYLLEPKVIRQTRDIGISPIQVIRHAAARIPPADVPGLARGVLANASRVRAMGVTSSKELLRLLLGTNTADAHNILLECAAGSLAKAVVHPDVKAVLVHGILSMLDNTITFKLLVDPDDLWKSLDSLLNGLDPTDPRSAEVKMVVFAACPNSPSVSSAAFRNASDGVKALLKNLSSYQRITITSEVNRAEYGKLLLSMARTPEVSDGPGELKLPEKVPTTKNELAAVQKAKEKHSEAVLAHHALLDVRSIALCILISLVELETKKGKYDTATTGSTAFKRPQCADGGWLEPSPVEIGIETELVAATLSFSEFASPPSVSKLHQSRAEMMDSSVPASLVTVAAHHALGCFPLKPKESPPNGAGGPLADVVDKLLTKVTGDSGTSTADRFAAARRLESIAAALKLVNTETIPTYGKASKNWNKKSSPPIKEHISSVVLYKRRAETLDKLDDEARVMKRVSRALERPRGFTAEW